MSGSPLRWIEPEWPAPSHVHALTTERGASQPDDPYDGFNFADYVADVPEKVEANRETLVKALGLTRLPVWLDQQHGTTILSLDEPGSHSGRTADGSVTRAEETVCAVLSADCAPVFLSDRQGSFVALLHVGWRGLSEGIIESGLAQIPGSVGEVISWVGPTISQKYFEIGHDVRCRLIENDASDEHFVAPSGARYFADLPGLIVARLSRAGVDYARASQECTYGDSDRWFSYRRQGLCGRMTSLIWIKR